MKQAHFIVDGQPCFNLPKWQMEGISRLAPTVHSVAAVGSHGESMTPCEGQLGWKPAPADEPLVQTDKVFVTHGYLPPSELIGYLKSGSFERILSAASRPKPAALLPGSCCSTPAFIQRCSSG